MNRLDFSRSYLEIHGLPGVSFQQDGINFKADGAEADDPEPYIEEVLLKAEEIIPINPLGESTPEISAPAETGNIDTMHWKTLKALVETYGGEWTNKQDALSFLRGKN